MSNVAVLEQRIGDELWFAPDMAPYRQDIRRVLSGHYLQLCAEREWQWLQRTEPLYAFPDLTIGNSQLVRNGPRTFTIPAGAVLEGSMYSELDSQAFEVFQDMLCGAELDLVDRDNREAGTGNWQFAPFVIENVDTNAGSVVLRLDPRCNITSLVAGLGTYVIRFRRTRLPARVDRVVSIVDELTHQELTPLSDATMRAFAADPERTGEAPRHWLSDGALDSGLPWIMGHTSPGLGAASETIRQVDNDPIYGNPPFTITVNGSGSNALKASTNYRVFICWVYAGRYGPPSRIVEASTTASFKNFALAALPVQNLGAAGTDLLGDTGRKLAVFIAEGDHGPFFEHSVMASGIVATVNIGTRPTTAFLPMFQRRWETLYPNGPYNYLRLWPRSDQQRRLLLTYVSKPLPLLDDVDMPQLPSAFDNVLVHGTVIAMISRFNAGANILRLQEALYKKAMGALYNRYLPPKGPPQKGVFGATPSSVNQFPTDFVLED